MVRSVAGFSIMSLETPNPYTLGYRMPAEWEPHAATWLAWPHNAETWPDQVTTGAGDLLATHRSAAKQ